MTNDNLLVDIIKKNGDPAYEKGMMKYTWENRKKLIASGIPYNFYLLIQTTSNNGCEYRYAFIQLFRDIEYPYLQKLRLIDLIKEVRTANKIPETQYGVAGKIAYFLNCDSEGRMPKVNNTRKYIPIMDWIRETVLDDDGMDKYGNLEKCFYNENFSMIERRPIFPIMLLGEKAVTGDRGCNSTEVKIIMGCPLELK